MGTDFLTFMQIAIVSPRKTIGYILSKLRSPADFSLLIVLLGVLSTIWLKVITYVLTRIDSDIFSRFDDVINHNEDGSLLRVFSDVAFATFTQAIVTTLIALFSWFTGKMIGGKGSLYNMYIVIAWWGLVNSILFIIYSFLIGIFIAFGGAVGNMLILMLATTYISYSYWVLASYITEVHGISNIMYVVFTILVLQILIWYGMEVIAV